MAPAGLKLDLVEIGQLPFYDQDLDVQPPSPWVAFRDRIRRADAVLFVTPSTTGQCRPRSRTPLTWARVPTARAPGTASRARWPASRPAAIGGFGANHHLRQSLVFLNVPVLQQPEAYLGGADKLFDERGGIVNESTRGLLVKYLTAFAAWIERNLAR